jgi:ABC-type uncharacterized transport system fused permease/ATPase subunit
LTGDTLQKKADSYYFDYFVSALFFFSTTILLLNMLSSFSMDFNYFALTIYILCTITGVVALKLLIRKTGRREAKHIMGCAIIIAAFSEIMLSLVYNTFFSPVLIFGPMITSAIILASADKILKGKIR